MCMSACMSGQPMGEDEINVICVVDSDELLFYR
jgi:hypothetical protein